MTIFEKLVGGKNLKITDSNKFILKLFSDSYQRNIRQNEKEKSGAAFIA